jgi:putative ABC transport system permease protein
VTGRRPSLDGLDEDIRDHLERETQDNIDRGMTPDDARDAALRAFGNVTLTMEDTRAVWIAVWFDQLLQDARYGARMLRRNPAFSAVVILTLALGIGLTTAVFSVVNAVLVRPLSFPHPERLLWIATFDDRSKGEVVISPDLVAWREHATSFEAIVGEFTGGERIDVGDEAVQARIAAVTDGFWDLTGARFAAGGPPEPGREGIVLSQAFFDRWFRGDARIVGRPVTVEGRANVVTGVLAAGFRPQLPRPPLWSSIDPGPIDFYRAAVVPAATPATGVLLFNVIGRLKGGVSIERAREELERIREARRAAEPRMPGPPHLRAAPYVDVLVGGARPTLLILLASVVLVLLIACANVANLLLARGSARQREIAIRTAVGAGRGRVLRQFLVESLILAGIGGAAGVAVARAAIALVVRLIPHAVPRLTETTVDGRVLAFAATTALATACLFGFAPGLAWWRASVHDVLKDGGCTVSAGAGGLRAHKLLVAVELALSAVLLVGAGLMIKSFVRITAWPPGFAPDRVLTMRMQFSGQRYRDALSRRAYIDDLLRRTRAARGVEAAGVSSNGDGRMIVVVEGMPEVPREQRTRATVSTTSAGYANAIGMRVVTGRWLTDTEPERALVINETLARRVFQGQDPIGRRITMGPAGATQTPVIVGVVADLRYANLDAPPESEIFFDYAHAQPFGLTLAVRTSDDPLAAAPAIRTIVAGIDRTLPVFDVKPLEATLADSVAPRRFNVLLLGTFAASALLLALVGIYGVIAYSVAQRTHEIGVRMALGAQRREIVRMVLRQGLAITSAGILMGLAAAFALTRVVASLLYDVAPTDPATFIAVVGVLAATALAACGGPALKAARVDPIVALRCE